MEHGVRQPPTLGFVTINPTTQAQRSALQASPPLSTMENGTVTQGEGKDPSGFLSEIIGNPVTVKLNSGVVYKGKYVP